MELHHILLTLLAGVGAGGINAIVGSGTLITFPALVAFGVPPVTATMSNAVGLIPGNIASSFGYRTELAGQKKRMLQLIPASLLGALTGAYLLLHLPEDAFITIVPVLLVLALLLVIFQPMLQRLLRDRAIRSAEEAAPSPEAAGHTGTPSMSIGRHIAVFIAVYATAVYGGYFAAAQGIILIALLGMLLPETLQRINGAKNVLVLVVNTVAAGIYVIVGFDRINWMAAGLIAAGSLIGGYLGARVGRKFSPVLLRSAIVILGLVALWNILQM
ncbi:sulfite exporter TauE/SafE family protein [Brevibacterium otitidis]|uniref:Probable membrane transporter protein n=1 Tax=Brevibacterium otitidis TaxID=53364 RepID=A0ABV5X3M5_9MICO|nr:sulfite exporter TauE/SafE family protein [Brevibacterium otitidis]